MGIILGGNFPGGNCPGRVIRSGNFAAGNCPAGRYPGWEFSGWESSRWQFLRSEFSCYQQTVNELYVKKCNSYLEFICRIHIYIYIRRISVECRTEISDLLVMGRLLVLYFLSPCYKYFS